VYLTFLFLFGCQGTKKLLFITVHQSIFLHIDDTRIAICLIDTDYLTLTDVLCENKFERVKEFIIEKYVELSAKLHGVNLYESLINDVLSYSHDKWNLEMPIRFLVVYIFDKCDIFEKSR